jgi:transposase
MAQQTIIGIDLAKHVFQVCMVTPTGTLKTNTAVARGKRLALIARPPPALIFMEACGGAHDWARRFGAMGHEVRLLAPQYVTPFRRGQKKDPNDALALTEAGQRPNIPTGPIKTVEPQDLQGLHRVRERLVKHRTAVVQQVRGLLLEYGMVIPQGLARLRKRLPRVIAEADNGFSFLRRDLLQRLQRELRALDTRMTEITAQLTRLSHEMEACQRLQEMEGIGPLSATALGAALGHGHDFQTGRQVAAWLGLVPRQPSSGGTTRLGGITKGGKSSVRRLLMHGARSVISHVRDKPDAKSAWMRQLVTRIGVNKACVAVAHKMARVAWALLHTGAQYRKPAVLSI